MAVTDLVDHGDADDGGVEVGAPRKMRRRVLGEAEGDAGLRKEGHPVHAAVLGRLMRERGAEPAAHEDAQRACGEEERARGHVAREHAEVHAHSWLGLGLGIGLGSVLGSGIGLGIGCSPVYVKKNR